MPEDAPSQPPPRIYVASLADYNDGYLHGVWINASAELHDIRAIIQQMLVAGHNPDAEEWAIHDYEGFWGLRLGEFEPIEWLAGVARGVAEHGEAFALWVEHFEPNQEQLSQFADEYLGRWDSVVDYAESLLEDTGEDLDELGPEHLRPYIHLNIEAYARDVASEASVIEGTSGIYVFSVE